jgi:hypothetical protein
MLCCVIIIWQIVKPIWNNGDRFECSEEPNGEKTGTVCLCISLGDFVPSHNTLILLYIISD